ncbi:MAG: hypothetical protein R3C18_26980 [Planctomycetaceae bacterium]
MASSLPNVKFQTAQSFNGVPNTSSMQNLLSKAKAGGQPTFDFFAQQMAVANQVAQVIAQRGDAAWEEVDQASELGFDCLDPNLPAVVVRAGGREGSGALVVQFRPGSAMQEDTENYTVSGVATVNLVTGNTTFDTVVSYVEKLGPAVPVAALAPAAMAILKSFKTFVQSYFTEAYTAAEGGATDATTIATESADAAAEEAAIDGEVIADEIAIDLVFSPLAVAGIAVAIVSTVLLIVLFFIAKTMTLMLRVYNMTSVPLQLQICYEHDVEEKTVPSSPNIPPIGVPPAPPGVTPLGSTMYMANYTLLNNNVTEGIGVALQSPFPVGGGLAIMIDIPTSGDNSIYVGFQGCTGDCEKNIWDQWKNKFKQLVQGSTGGSYTATIATNVLRGKTPSPITGDNGYYYEFAVIIEETGVA